MFTVSIKQAELNYAVITKSASIGKTMIIVIILLYIVTTINFGIYISCICSIFVENATTQSIVTKYLIDVNPGLSRTVGMGAMSVICSTLADAIMVHMILLEL